MSNEEEALRHRMQELKDQIAAHESVLQALWLELIDVRVRLAAAKQIDDENGGEGQ